MRNPKSKLWTVIWYRENEWPDSVPDVLAVDRAGGFYLGRCGDRKLSEIADSEFKQCSPEESFQWLITTWGSPGEVGTEGMDLALWAQALLVAFELRKLPSGLTTKKQQRK